MGGMSSSISQAIGNKGAQAAPAQPSAGYTPAVTQPAYQPQFSAPVQQAAQQQMAYQQQMNPYFSQPQPSYTPQQQGLQQLLGNMMSRYQQPQGLPQQQMMPQQAMPQYGRFNSAVNPLAYRPNMQAAQQNLRNVKPSVYKTDLDAARAKVAELQAQIDAANAASYSSPYDGGGGGG